MKTFISDNANHLYLQTLYSLAVMPVTSAPRGMPISEVIGPQVILTDATRCLVTVPARKLNYPFAVAEFWWIATGREDVASIEPYCSEIAKFSDDGRVFYGAYGPRWHHAAAYVVRTLKADPDSRQAVIDIWRPDIVHLERTPKDVPCTISHQYFIRDGKLHAITTMRSWDAWLGMPYDVFNHSRLASIIAGELGVELGSLIVKPGSLHLYDRDRAKVLKLFDDVGPPAAISKAPPIRDLPGLIPSELIDLDMANLAPVTMGAVADVPGIEPWLPYLRTMGCRFYRDTGHRADWEVGGLAMEPTGLIT